MPEFATREELERFVREIVRRELHTLAAAWRYSAIPERYEPGPGQNTAQSPLDGLPKWARQEETGAR